MWHIRLGQYIASPLYRVPTCPCAPRLPSSLQFFHGSSPCCCFFVCPFSSSLLSLVLEMVTDQYTCSVFHKQMLWKLSNLSVSCFVVRQHCCSLLRSNSVTEAAASVLRQSQSRNQSSQYCPTSSSEPYIIDDHVQTYWCEQPRWKDGRIVSGEYNEGMAPDLKLSHSVHCELLNFGSTEP